MQHVLRGLVALWLIGLLSACTADDNPLPTLARPDQLPTDIALTENAPPAGFDSVSFPRIDDNLRALPGWRYEMTLRFDGVFARTPRETHLLTQADVRYNQVASARRVVATVDNDLQGEGDPVQYEAVRLGPDAFLVRDEGCLSNAAQDARLAADLSAGELLGGVQQAETAAQKAVINSEEVWRYAFDERDMVLPNVTFGDGSRILSMTGELWVAPQHNAVVRYYVNLEVENITLLDSALPVSGTLLLRYDLYDVGDVPNISVPFGC